MFLSEGQYSFSCNFTVYNVFIDILCDIHTNGIIVYFWYEINFSPFIHVKLSPLEADRGDKMSSIVLPKAESAAVPWGCPAIDPGVGAEENTADGIRRAKAHV